METAFGVGRSPTRRPVEFVGFPQASTDVAEPKKQAVNRTLCFLELFPGNRARAVDDLATEYGGGYLSGRADPCQLVAGLRVDAHVYCSCRADAQGSRRHDGRTDLRVEHAAREYPAPEAGPGACRADRHCGRSHA